MTGLQLIFIINAVVTIGSALMMVTSRRMLNAALWLVLTLLGVAGVFAILELAFFAIIQVVVYVGAIAILVIFALMLTHDAVDDTYLRSRRWVLTAIFSLILLAGILLAISSWQEVFSYPTPLTPDQLSVTELGLALVNPEKFALPFEVTSLLLLAALTGGIYVAMERKERNK